MPEPTINEYLEFLRGVFGRSVERTRRAFEKELILVRPQRPRKDAAARVLNQLQEEFESSVTAALEMLRRISDTTSLNASELRGLTAQELENFARQMKSIARIDSQFGALDDDFLDGGFQTRVPNQPRSGQLQPLEKAMVDEEYAKIDDYLRLALRQFDVGLFDSARPPAQTSQLGPLHGVTPTAGTAPQAIGTPAIGEAAIGETPVVPAPPVTNVIVPPQAVPPTPQTVISAHAGAALEATSDLRADTILVHPPRQARTPHTCLPAAIGRIRCRFTKLQRGKCQPLSANVRYREKRT